MCWAVTIHVGEMYVFVETPEQSITGAAIISWQVSGYTGPKSFEEG